MAFGVRVEVEARMRGTASRWLSAWTLLIVLSGCVEPTDGLDFSGTVEQSEVGDVLTTSEVDSSNPTRVEQDGLRPASEGDAQDGGGSATSPDTELADPEGEGLPPEDTQQPPDTDSTGKPEDTAPDDTLDENDAEIPSDGEFGPTDSDGEPADGAEEEREDAGPSAQEENDPDTSGADGASDSWEEPSFQPATSCEERCGEEASDEGGCGCDEDCEASGTCCEDRCDVCSDQCESESAGSCVGACGMQALDGLCFCDSTCAGFGDCCPDACAECGVGCNPGEAPEVPCADGLTYAGCCDGSALVWCENGATTSIECTFGCGEWKSDLNYYDCLSSSSIDSSPEPSGSFPLLCEDIQGGEKSCIQDGDCNDGDACSGIETCQGGLCASGEALQCDDTNPCTADSCHPQTGCVSSPVSGVLCGGEGACDSGGTCDNGMCVSGPGPCDDGNSCTLDSCEETPQGDVVCSHESLEGCVPEGPSWPEVESALQSDCGPCHFGGNQSTFTKAYTEANHVYMIYRIVEEQMPPSGLASPELAGLIQSWVDSGASD